MKVTHLDAQRGEPRPKEHHLYLLITQKDGESIEAEGDIAEFSLEIEREMSEPVEENWGQDQRIEPTGRRFIRLNAVSLSPEASSE